MLGSGVSGSRLVDLFAGTGAIGIEALSRGAAEVVFVENHAPAVNLIRRNLASLDIRSGFTVLSADALRGLELLNSRQKKEKPAYDYVFLDPPYAAVEEYARVLEFLGWTDLLASGGIAVAEHHRKFDLPEKAGALRRVRVLRQGDAVLSFYRRESKAGGENHSAQ